MQTWVPYSGYAIPLVDFHAQSAMLYSVLHITYCLEVLWHDIFRYLKKRYYDMNIPPICVVQTSDITCQSLATVAADMWSFFPAPQASSLLKHVTGTTSLQGHADSLLDASVRHFSSAPSAQSASTEENGYAVLLSYLELSLCSVLLLHHVNYCLLLICKVILPGVRAMACWHLLQLAGRAMICIL